MDNHTIENAKKYIQLFSDSTNLEGILIDHRGKTLYTCRPEDHPCSICQKIEHRKCEESHLFGAYQAELYGGSYIFYCHIGLVHFAAPIIRHQKMIGAYIGGHLLMTPPDELLYDQVKARTSEAINVRAMLNKLPQVSPKRVKALSELLQTLAQKVSDETVGILHEKQQDYHFNQGLSEYIQKLKMHKGELNLQLQYSVDKEKELLKFVALGDKKRAAKLLDSIMVETIYLSGKDIGLLKTRTLELIVLLSRATLETGTSLQEVLGYNYVYLNQVKEFDKIDDLIRWMNEVLLRFMDCVFDLSEVKHINAIHKTMNYIKENYMKKLTLSEVAKEVGFTPQYLSKIFKEETKHTFKSYLRKVRIENSKALLSEKDLSLPEIAYMVGFSDQSHFSRSFKNVEGYNPSEYKKCIV